MSKHHIRIVSLIYLFSLLPDSVYVKRNITQYIGDITWKYWTNETIVIYLQEDVKEKHAMLKNVN